MQASPICARDRIAKMFEKDIDVCKFLLEGMDQFPVNRPDAEREEYSCWLSVFGCEIKEDGECDWERMRVEMEECINSEKGRVFGGILIRRWKRQVEMKKKTDEREGQPARKLRKIVVDGKETKSEPQLESKKSKRKRKRKKCSAKSHTRKRNREDMEESESLARSPVVHSYTFDKDSPFTVKDDNRAKLCLYCVMSVYAQIKAKPRVKPCELTLLFEPFVTITMLDDWMRDAARLDQSRDLASVTDSFMHLTTEIKSVEDLCLHFARSMKQNQHWRQKMKVATGDILSSYVSHMLGESRRVHYECAEPLSSSAHTKIHPDSEVMVRSVQKTEQMRELYDMRVGLVHGAIGCETAAAYKERVRAEFQHFEEKTMFNATLLLKCAHNSMDEAGMYALICASRARMNDKQLMQWCNKYMKNVFSLRDGGVEWAGQPRQACMQEIADMAFCARSTGEKALICDWWEDFKAFKVAYKHALTIEVPKTGAILPFSPSALRVNVRRHKLNKQKLAELHLSEAEKTQFDAMRDKLNKLLSCAYKRENETWMYVKMELQTCCAEFVRFWLISAEVKRLAAANRPAPPLFARYLKLFGDYTARNSRGIFEVIGAYDYATSAPPAQKSRGYTGKPGGHMTKSWLSTKVYDVPICAFAGRTRDAQYWFEVRELQDLSAARRIQRLTWLGADKQWKQYLPLGALALSGMYCAVAFDFSLAVRKAKSVAWRTPQTPRIRTTPLRTKDANLYLGKTDANFLVVKKMNLHRRGMINLPATLILFVCLQVPSRRCLPRASF